MTRNSLKVNRGPAAAAENRAALLHAARKLFSERGYHVPLSAIASAAGVGQGVLYRHFPTRLDLAIAVFETHFQRYEAIASENPGPGTFAALWRQIVDHLVIESAFLDMAIDARRSRPDYDGMRRLIALLAEPLHLAAEARTIPADVTVDEVVLAVRMAYGIVRTAEDGATTEQLRSTVLDAFPRLQGSPRTHPAP